MFYTIVTDPYAFDLLHALPRSCLLEDKDLKRPNAPQQDGPASRGHQRPFRTLQGIMMMMMMMMMMIIIIIIIIVIVIGVDVVMGKHPQPWHCELLLLQVQVCSQNTKISSWRCLLSIPYRTLPSTSPRMSSNKRTNECVWRFIIFPLCWNAIISFRASEWPETSGWKDRPQYTT